MKRLLRQWIAQGISKLPKGLLIDIEFFELFQSKGWHIVPNHFYDPIPDTSRLPDSLWDRPSAMVGVEPNIAGQVAFLEAIATRYLPEYRAISAAPPASPVEYSRACDFAGIDGAILYAMIRTLKPKRIIEIGSGHSTLLSLLALRRNREEDSAQAGQFTAIEPYPSPAVRAALAGEGTLLEERVEALPLATFQSLAANDILFIDSSHSVKIGSDVLYEILEILPRLPQGVHVHIHDIFLPYHYPREWVKGRKIFWTEQYLLQAFLAFNREFEVLWSPGAMTQHRPERLAAHFPDYDPDRQPAGSFWIRRCG